MGSVDGDNKFEVVKRVENDEWDTRSERQTGLGTSGQIMVTSTCSSAAHLQ